MSKQRKNLKYSQKLTSSPRQAWAGAKMAHRHTGRLLSPPASPVKSKPRQDDTVPVQPNLASFTLPLPDPWQPSAINYFPASDQPISEQTMKSVLISLKHTLYTDLSAAVFSLANTVEAQDQCIHHVETKINYLFTAHKVPQYP